MEEINLTSVIEGVYFLGSLYTEGDSFSQKYFASAKGIPYDGNGIILHNVLVAFKRNLLKEGTLCVESHNIDETGYNRRSKVNGNTIDILRINVLIVKFLQDKKKYRKRRAKISADISARLFRVTCNKVSGILIHKN